MACFDDEVMLDPGSEEEQDTKGVVCWSYMFKHTIENVAKGRGRGRGKGRGRGEKKVIATCFSADCDKKVKQNSKYCSAHTKDMATMLRQAQKDDQVEDYKIINGDGVKASLALKKFAADNANGNYRKKNRLDDVSSGLWLPC
eukprot:6492749-Amphidinium_carterae.5